MIDLPDPRQSIVDITKQSSKSMDGLMFDVRHMLECLQAYYSLRNKLLILSENKKKINELDNEVNDIIKEIFPI